MDTQEVNNIVVVGTSAGGFAALSRLMGSLPKQLNAAMFIVIHVGRSSMNEVILKHLQNNTSLNCKVAEDGEYIKNNTIYLAQADHHLLVERNKVVVQRGAYENHWRPAIDVLFRSAAAAYDSCVTGIILTGLLDDGTSGMSAIQRSGGVCVVQEPSDAEFPDMPNNVINNITVDQILPIEEIGQFITRRYTNHICVPFDVPEDVKLEAEITKRRSTDPEKLTVLGDPTMLTCPDCGGTLRKVEQESITRYRCYTGHTFTEKILEEQQRKSLEDSLWVAIRMMEERRNLLNNLSSGYTNGDDIVQSKVRRSDDIKTHIDRLKSMLMDMK